jgi:hypothetical protein
MDISNQQFPGSTYVIIFTGRLEEPQAEWFEPLRINSLPGGASLLSGTVADEAALQGMLNRIQELGLPLLYMKRDGSHLYETLEPPIGG